jgi:hypothetical protein
MYTRQSANKFGIIVAVALSLVLLTQSLGTSDAASCLAIAFNLKSVSTVGTPHSVAVGDFNNDGTPDLAAANFSASSISILLGNGDGTIRSAWGNGRSSSPKTGKCDG